MTRKYYPCNCGHPFHCLVVFDLRDLTDDEEITDEQNELLLALVTEKAPLRDSLRWAWRYLCGKEDYYWHEIVLSRDVAYALGSDLRNLISNTTELSPHDETFTA